MFKIINCKMSLIDNAITYENKMDWFERAERFEYFTFFQPRVFIYLIAISIRRKLR